MTIDEGRRKLARGFIPHWASHPQEEGADKFNQTHKVIFTKTLDGAEWDNTVLAKGDLVDEITKLKFHLFINPTTIGNGLTIFKELDRQHALTLVRATPFDCGIVVLHYESKQ